MVTVRAFAKINLFLEILGRRADGYHDLRSVLVPVALHDTVRLHRSAAGVKLEVRYEGLPEVSLGRARDNLAVRAAMQVREAAGLRDGVRIELCKRIPVGGGLGGGSADAAAVLWGMNRLYGLRLARRTLMQLGARLGSDVPAMVRGGAVCMHGRGERVRGVCPAPACAAGGFAVVLANPGIASPTAQIYRSCKGTLTAPEKWYINMTASVRRKAFDGVCGFLYNSLQESVLEKFPSVRHLYERLQNAGSPGVLVSGSGASVFALAKNFAQAEGIRRALPSDGWNVVTQTLPDGVMVAHGPLEP